MSNNGKDSNDPHDPDSKISRNMRLAYWITGGSTRRRGPSTAASLAKLAQERCEVAKAEVEWKRRQKEALDTHLAQWGRSGLAGRLEEMAASGPRPRGRGLIQWWKDNGEGRGRTGGGGGDGERTTERGSEQESRTAASQRSEAAAESEASMEGQVEPAEEQQCGGADDNGDAEPRENGENGGAGAASEVAGQ